VNCLEAGRLLPLISAGTLETRRAVRVMEHLALCSSCRVLEHELARTRRRLLERSDSRFEKKQR